jgi:hypothetical protein
MAKLVYWVVPCLDDHPCYNVRAKTKKQALEWAERHGDSYDSDRITKVEVFYKDAFDLMKLAMGEGGIDEDKYD